MNFAPDPRRPLRTLSALPGFAATALRTLARPDGPDVLIKDERSRLGLPAFKALGGVHAVAMLLEDLRRQDPNATPTFVCASAGNHGLAVATGARLLGANARVHLPRGTPAAFAQRLEAAGAQVVIGAGLYDETVLDAQADATATGAILLSDAATSDHLVPPALVMEGYTLIAEELRTVFEVSGRWPTHVYLQAGVGGLAATIAHDPPDLAVSARPRHRRAGGRAMLGRQRPGRSPGAGRGAGLGDGPPGLQGAVDPGPHRAGPLRRQLRHGQRRGRPHRRRASGFCRPCHHALGRGRLRRLPRRRSAAGRPAAGLPDRRTPALKLLYQTHSPFARKALVFAHEAGLADRIQVIHHETSPTARNAEVFALNPLGKVPVLITDEGEAIFDSGVICQYLDAEHGGMSLIPTNPAKRIAALRLQAVADGLSEAGILVRWETVRRPPDLRYPPLAEGHLAKVADGCAWLEASFQPHEIPGLAEVAIATALSWLAFRQILDVSAACPRLWAWYETFEQRPSMRATALAGDTVDH